MFQPVADEPESVVVKPGFRNHSQLKLVRGNLLKRARLVGNCAVFALARPGVKRRFAEERPLRKIVDYRFAISVRLDAAELDTASYNGIQSIRLIAGTVDKTAAANVHHQ